MESENFKWYFAEWGYIVLWVGLEKEGTSVKETLSLQKYRGWK
jgi:hypothetical protein